MIWLYFLFHFLNYVSISDKNIKLEESLNTTYVNNSLSTTDSFLEVVRKDLGIWIHTLHMDAGLPIYQLGSFRQVTWVF